MQTIIWAIASMLVLTLIISFLPLGYTLKGKSFVVLASFLVALGGLAAVSTFPLWQTALIIFALVFFVAYFMNNRLGSLLYNGNPEVDHLIDEKLEDYKSVYELEGLEDSHLNEIDGDSLLIVSSNIKLEKETVNDQSPLITSTIIDEEMDNSMELNDIEGSFLQDRDSTVQETEQMKEDTNQENGYLAEIEGLLEIEEKTVALEENVLEANGDLPIILIGKGTTIVNEPATIDEDLSFLLERDSKDEVIENIAAETNQENGYLAEIESLLEFEEKDEVEANTGTLDDDDVLEEITVLPTIVVEEKAAVPIVDEDFLDDTLFDFLLAKKEVAVDREEQFEKKETKK